MVVGIEKHSSAMMSPDVSTIFEIGDIVLLVGEKDKITELIKADSIEVV